MISSTQMVPAKKGFTLIELLTVIAIVGILTAILIPTVGRVQETARRTVDQSNIRQIGNAALIYANDYDGRLPGTVRTPIATDGTVDLTNGNTGEAVSTRAFAAALARNGGMNEANLWVSRSDQAAQNNPPLTSIIETPTSAAPTGVVNTEFAASTTVLSYMGVSGLSTTLPASTPVVFTRGLQETGLWAVSPNPPTVSGGVYSSDGGYISFLGGNVQFFTALSANPLTATDGSQTEDIRLTIPDNGNAGITTYDGVPLSGSPGQTPGGGS